MKKRVNKFYSTEKVGKDGRQNVLSLKGKESIVTCIM